MSSNMDNDQNLQTVTEPAKGYALSGKIMLSAIVILFAVVVFMVVLHLYARWYLVRLRRRQQEQRRGGRGRRTQILLYVDGGGRGSAATADRGLELPVLNSLPVYLYSRKAEQPPQECAVCLSEFTQGEIVRHLPKCNHTFHLDCIDMWFHSHSTCPLDRSAVEFVPERHYQASRVTPPPDRANLWPPESGSSTSAADGLCATCQMEGSGGGSDTTPLGARRKGMDLTAVRIEVPPRRTESESELTQCSPAASRLLSFKRILSMGRRSPAGGGVPTTPCGAGTSDGATELDLESGLSELDRDPSRLQPPV